MSKFLYHPHPLKQACPEEILNQPMKQVQGMVQNDTFGVHRAGFSLSLRGRGKKGRNRKNGKSPVLKTRTKEKMSF
jgi:hypothetical protein